MSRHEGNGSAYGPGEGAVKSDSHGISQELPPILLVEDMARIFRLTLGAARKMILRNDCGPFVRIGRRLAIRREVFLEHVKRLEAGFAGPPSRSPKRDAEVANSILDSLRGK